MGYVTHLAFDLARVSLEQFRDGTHNNQREAPAGTQYDARSGGKRDAPGEESRIHVVSELGLARSRRMPQAIFREVPNRNHSASEPVDTAPSTRNAVA